MLAEFEFMLFGGMNQKSVILMYSETLSRVKSKAFSFQYFLGVNQLNHFLN